MRRAETPPPPHTHTHAHIQMHGVWLQSLPGAARLPSLAAIRDREQFTAALDRWRPAVLGHGGAGAAADPFLARQLARVLALVDAARDVWAIRAARRARARAARTVRRERYAEADAAAGRKVPGSIPVDCVSAWMRRSLLIVPL